MSTFDEYAAAVRQLSVQVREGERGAAAEAERRRRLHAGVAQVGQRLAAQGQRLDQLGEAIGLPPATAAVPDGPDAASGPPVATAAVDPDADPGVVLEEARRLVDEADLRTREVEALAARPELLPTWSPRPGRWPSTSPAPPPACCSCWSWWSPPAWGWSAASPWAPGSAPGCRCSPSPPAG